MFLHFLSLKLGPRLKSPDVTYELCRGKKWEDETFTAHTTPMHLKLPHTMKEGDIYIWFTYNPLSSVKRLKIYPSEHWVEKVKCVCGGKKQLIISGVTANGA